MLTESRERRQQGAATRARWTNAAFSAGFLAAAVALAVLGHADRALRPAARRAPGRRLRRRHAGRVRRRRRHGRADQRRPRPDAAAPADAGRAAARRRGDRARRRRQAARTPCGATQRAVTALADAWFSVGPALVLVLAGAQTPAWDDAPWYVARARGAARRRRRDHDGARAGSRSASALPPWCHDLALVYRVDALLAPVGLLAAFGAAVAALRRAPRAPAGRRSSRCSPASARRASTARWSSRRPTAARRCCSAT